MIFYGTTEQRMTSFDTTTEQLPDAPVGSSLVRVEFSVCPNSDLSVLLQRHNGTVTLDRHGVNMDGWWVIRCKNLPDRLLRITNGSRSLTQLLFRYGFQDSTGCVNHKRAIAHYSHVAPNRSIESVPASLRDATGVPQLAVNSGVCWFATMCWTSMTNPLLRALLLEHMRDPTLQDLFRRSIFDANAARSFRSRLWHEFHLGDDVTQPPEMDGCNGFSEFCTLCGRLKVPISVMRRNRSTLEAVRSVRDKKGNTIRLTEPTPGRNHVLAIRYIDGDHRTFPVLRRVTRRLSNGTKVRYRLAAVYIGGKKCGHQIAMSSPLGHEGSWRQWYLSDADMHKDGIGPVFIKFNGKEWRETWWDAWKCLVHVTKFGNNQFCPLSPHNLPDNALDTYRGACGTVSLDLLYVTYQ